MGQYHMIVCLEAGEHLNPHDLGAGLKAWEQVANTYGTACILPALIAVNPGNQPADLGSSQVVGRWAGKRILAIGDYAENGDIPDFEGPPLSWLYGLCHDMSPEEFQSYLDELRDNNVQGWEELEAAVKHYGLFENLSPACHGTIEEACSVRFAGDGWLDVLPVSFLAFRQEDGRPTYQLRPDSARVTPQAIDAMLTVQPDKTDVQANVRSKEEGVRKLREYLDCRGITEEMWNRPPKNAATHGLIEDELDAGQSRVYANLDRAEFIDPAQFGEVPTTAGTMNAPGFSSKSALLATLFHPERRGGGDLYSNHQIIGTWRNNRLIATAEHGEDFPTTEEVRKTFTDITPSAIEFCVQESKL